MQDPFFIRIVYEMIIRKMVKTQKPHTGFRQSVQPADLVFWSKFRTVRPGLVTVEKHLRRGWNMKRCLCAADDLTGLYRHLDNVCPGRQNNGALQIIDKPFQFHNVETPFFSAASHQYRLESKQVTLNFRDIISAFYYKSGMVTIRAEFQIISKFVVKYLAYSKWCEDFAALR